MAAQDLRQETRGPTRIVEAAENGDIAEVKKILSKFPDKVDITYGGSTALQKAAYHGHIALIRYLHQRGADVNFVDSHRNSPLHYAVRGKQIDIVKQLLEMRANMNLENDERQTPPQMAYAKKFDEFVHIFQTKDKNVRLEPDEIKPKLLCAALFPETKSMKVIKCLHGCGSEACVTFEPCNDSISCLACCMKSEFCKNCGRRIEKISFPSDSNSMKILIGELINLRKENEDLKKKRECQICNDKDFDCVLLECYHVFCSHCALQLQKKKICPICREQFSGFKKFFSS